MKKIFTKRNALLGWTAWKVGKGIAKKKAKSAVPGTSKSRGKKKPAAILAGLGAALGGLAFLKRKRKSGDSSSSD
jgi:hypothetical protein